MVCLDGALLCGTTLLEAPIVRHCDDEAEFAPIEPIEMSTHRLLLIPPPSEYDKATWRLFGLKLMG
jgi:hypothetical protein